MSTYAVRKITDEIMISRECLQDIAVSVLGTDYKNCVSYKEAITNHIRKENTEELELFLKIYEQHLRYICNNRKYYLGEETYDCMQFIRMELCKIYHKKYMYTNFDKVVKAVIKRKAIDFSKARNCDIKGLINESDFMNCDEDSDTDLDSMGNVMHEKLDAEVHNTFYEFGKTIKTLVEKISGDAIFTKWDRVLIKHINRHVSKGECDIDMILDRMQGSKTEVRFRFNMMVKRIKTNIDKDMFV